MTDLDSAFQPIQNFTGEAQESADEGVVVPFPNDAEMPADLPPQHWFYHDENGHILMIVCRWDPPNGRKKVLPRTYRRYKDGRHAWVWKGLKLPRPIYNLDLIAMHQEKPILVCEGEKSAKAAAAIFPSYVTTTSPNGSQSAEKADWSPLKGKKVYIWPDNDGEGKKYAEDVARLALKAGARVVSIVNVPEGLPEGWDLADELPAENSTVDNDLLTTLLENAVPFEKITNDAVKTYSLAKILEDFSPPPDDLIGPRLLTPGGLLVIAGAPKVGKSDFVLNLLLHAAAGVNFLRFYIPKPLKIFYLQAEIMYPYLKERIQQNRLPATILNVARENLIVTGQLRMILNDTGVENVVNAIQASFSDVPPDIIVIDPIRNVFDGGPDYKSLGENDNSAMLFFLQQRVTEICARTNPEAGIILIHHTKKLSKQQLKEDPFQALSGASSLRGFYSSGMLIFRPSEENAVRKVVMEIRNGPEIPSFFIDKISGAWLEVDQSHARLTNAAYGEKLDAERRRKHDVILGILHEEALKGALYTANQFCEKFESKGGLGSKSTISSRIGVLMTTGYIKAFKDKNPQTGMPPGGSKYGFLCVEDMNLGPEITNEETGDIIKGLIPIKPTHYKSQETGGLMAVENPDIWVYPDKEDANAPNSETTEN